MAQNEKPSQTLNSGISFLKTQFKKPPGIYLLNHSVGCLPNSIEKIISENYLQPWETMGGNAWEKWIENIENFKSSLAGLFSANAEDFCSQTNVSSSIAKILSSLPNRIHKNAILVSNLDFPSAFFSLSHAKSFDKKLCFLSENKEFYDSSNWAASINQKTELVFITHVTSDTSQQAPVEEIVKIAKQFDAITIVDVAQSAGIIPIKFSDWDADFIVGSCVKWLCGGPGAGFLWVNPNILSRCKPNDVGWFSHQNPFELNLHNFEYADNASRFWGGTPSILPYVIATKAIDQITKIGIQNIRKHNLFLLSLIFDACTKSHINVISPDKKNHKGGTMTIKFNDVEKANHVLRKNNIYFDIRQNNLFRFSPHIYTAEEEIQTFIDVLSTC